jgi:hypothetical protein
MVARARIGGLVRFSNLALTLRGLTTSRTLKTSIRGVLDNREAYLVGDKSVWLMAYSWREWL